MLNRIKRGFIPVVKLAVAIALITFLLKQGTLDLSLFLEGGIDPWLVIGGVGLYVGTYSLSSFRWKLILHCQGMKLPFGWIHRMAYLGVFFNYFIPGGVGGDAMRMAYIAQKHPKCKSAAALSVFMDKVLGLYSILFLSLIMVIINRESVLASEPLKVLALVALGVVISVLLGFFTLFMVVERSTRLQNWMQQKPDSWTVRILQPLVQLIRLYHQQKVRLMLALMVSIIAQSLPLICIMWVALNLELGELSAWQYAFATPWAWIANLLPLTPGGLGVGEGAFDQVCRWIEPGSIAPYGTIFLVNRILAMIASLPGLVVYLFYRKHEPVI